MLRREQLLQELEHDSYKSARKLAEPAHCPDCRAVYHEGRWRWGAVAPQSRPERCPACQRVHDELPAGYVTVQGEFSGAHREEIDRLIRNCETQAKAEHPLQRIMNVAPEGDGLLVTTTDPHLARRIGDALHDAWKGELDYHYNKEDNLLRVHWRR